MAPSIVDARDASDSNEQNSIVKATRIFDIESDSKKSKVDASEKENWQTFVIKKDGRSELFNAEKLKVFISKLLYGLDSKFMDIDQIIRRIGNGLTQNISITDLNQLTIDVCASNVTTSPDFSLLAGRIATSFLHSHTTDDFVQFIRQALELCPENQLISTQFLDFVEKNSDKIAAAIDYSYDYTYNYFAMRTLMATYLIKGNKGVIERPQHLLMRVSLYLNIGDIDAAIRTYHLLKEKLYTPATPTLCNSGSPTGQLSSCFLLTVIQDSIEGIYQTLYDSAIIAKYVGGTGISLSHIRASGSQIRNIKNACQGIIPLIKVLAASTMYVKCGGNHRPVASSLYLEPWHFDIFEFLDLRKNQGNEEKRARNIFTALWIPDLFMQRVEQDADWSLMCPYECPGLCDVYGEEFEALYTKYEREGKMRTTCKARQVWSAIIESQVETGTPYMTYKDHANRKNNQKNLGVIRGSNLCTEIMEYSSADEISVCNLASICLPRFVDRHTQSFDFQKLFEVTKVASINLDKVIDINYYPVERTRRSNLKHRPFGLGVQGLADVFILLRLPYDSPKARQLNRYIFETIYFGALSASCERAEQLGTYESYEGSPASQGLLQYDLWNQVPQFQKWDWQALKERIKRFGLRNSLTTCAMPTASTSIVLGNNECIEPYTSNIYLRRVISGEFQVVNPHLVQDLIRLDLWNKRMKNAIIKENGSIQNIPQIPDDIKTLYRTAWEISQKSLIEMSADRAPFIDQSQSLNIFLSNPTYQQVTSAHFYGWKKGLKTGMYYLRTRAASNAIKYTIDNSHSSSTPLAKQSSLVITPQMSADQINQAEICRLNDPESCHMCGS